MSNFQQQYALWDEFLSVWPASQLATMTLDDYSQAGSKDSFTYWIESRLDTLGSIWGGSSSKFGVFSRKDTEDKKSDAKLSYSDTHGWYSSLGATAEEAFEKVRDYVVQVATLAAEGDLDGIDALPLDEAFKWKIAFLYQNRQAPVIVNIFKRAPLVAFVGGTASQSMAALQRAALAQRSERLSILEFGRQVWEAWQKNLAIWKLSHGNPPNFTGAERQQYLDGQWAVMHRDTGKKQGKKFAQAPVGTLFFLCHGNSPQRIGQFTSKAMPCAKGNGWLQRSYRVLKPALDTKPYTTNTKGWSPRGNSTFWKVSVNDLPEFESTLLKPYFGTDLAELAALAGEPIEAVSLGDGVAPPPVAAPSTANPRTATCFNRIYYGPPGTGKTYTLMQLLKRDYETQDEATKQRYSFVTFHQSYGYEEFVEGLRPVLDGDGEAGEVAYEIRPGVFKELCRKARQAPDQRFAMVIDEINRGNISKIFGELITLIEPDKRDPLDGSKPPVELTLAYSGEKFSVPANVDIIGTMNTADRSLALLDTALRRRFDFVPLLPDTRAVKVPGEPHSAPLAGLVVSTDAGEIDVRRMLERINERIEVLYDRDHCIGHAYFTHLWRTTDGTQRFEALADTFRNRMLPLLEEYFFEDWRKIRLVLGDNQKPDAAQFITECDAHDQALDKLFGNDHGLDSGTTQRRYQLQPSAFDNPASYLGIYQPLA
jgi:5-methylcytosine-specific restriction endonuclease McrBC GTP-binding regulatory subunit McrB